MNIKYGTFFIGGVLSIAGLTGCKKFVEVNTPVTQLVTASVFNNNSTATAAQTVIYTGMSGDYNTYTIEYYTGLSGDELALDGQSNLSANSLNAFDDAATFTNNWDNPYKYIFQANAVLEGLRNYSGVSASVQQQLTGEAKFIRAFWHFYLVNLFGDVPLVTSTNYQVNAKASRTPKAQVYQQIITDLLDAQNLLNSNFIDASDTAITKERVRPTKSAAAALLARAYLYNGDWVDAEAQATAVIGNTMFSLETDLNKVFLKNSAEAIWQLQADPASFHTTDGSNFILTGAGTGLSSQLLNAFEVGDNRRTAWVDSIIVLGTTYYYPYKYKAGNTSTSVSEYKMALRLAEQYLIRAEARGKQGHTGEAIADLNTVRARAGLAALPGTLTASQVLAAVAHERQVELFTEWGDRWFDLKRTGAIDSVMNIVTPLKGGVSWRSYQQLYPIPLSDMQNDPNLIQTPGY